MITHNFNEIVKGNTFKGAEFEVIVNGVPRNLTNAVITAWFRYGNETGPIKKQLSVGSGLTKSNPVAGKFTMDAFRVTFDKPGNYFYDVLIEDGVDFQTYVGGVLPVKQNVTD